MDDIIYLQPRQPFWLTRRQFAELHWETLKSQLDLARIVPTDPSQDVSEQNVLDLQLKILCAPASE